MSIMLSFFRSNNKRRKWKKMQLPMKMTSLQKIPKNQKIELEKVVVANASIQIIPACWPFWYITQVITFYMSHLMYTLHMGHFCFGKICKCINWKYLNMFTHLIYYPVARRNFSLITFNWLANALVYNGLSFYSANLNVSSHLGFFISSAVEIPSYFLGWYFMDRWGRRWILFATMMTGGVSCICCMFVPLGKCITVYYVKIGKIKYVYLNRNLKTNLSL